MSAGGSFMEHASQPSNLISRREALLGVVVCLIANHALQIVDASSFLSILSGLASQNLIYWFACYVIISHLLASSSEPTLSKNDSIFVIGLCLLILMVSFIAYRFTIGFLTTLLALWMMRSFKDDVKVKSAGIVLMAMAVHLVWAPLLFRLFMEEFLLLDAAAISVVLSNLRPDIVQAGTTFSGEDHAITLVGACSSFHNVSLAILAVVAAIMCYRTELRRSDVAWLLITCTAMIAINVVRIALVAWDAEMYIYWHDGAGVKVLSVIQTAVIIALAAYGAWRGGSASR